MNICDGIHNWAYIIARLQGAAGCGYQEDWLGMSANLAGGAGKTLWYLRNQIPKLNKAIKAVKPTATYVVDIAMVITQLLDFLNGFWIPDEGELLVHGEEQFKTLYYTLLLACPDDHQWSGDTEQYYAARNVAQQDQAQKMRELDAQLRDRVHQQAVEVESAHLFIAMTLMGLLLAQGIALALCLIPETGALISWRFQISVAIPAVCAVVGKEIYTATQSTTHAHAIDELADQYDQVNAELQRSGAYRHTELAGMPRSAVSFVEPTFGSPIDFSLPPAREVTHPENEPIVSNTPELAQLVSLLEQPLSGQWMPNVRRRDFAPYRPPAVPRSSAPADTDQTDQQAMPTTEDAVVADGGFGVVDLAAGWGAGHHEEVHTEVA
ncbi:MAG: hypothetical protein K2Q25_03215 [Mycobacteriaceae bacterium]|nr:hypothetical protein [Mycobacteriaceae bacterium]